MLNKLSKRINNQKGMTLIELIIVIAIIGILAVIGISQFGGMTEAAREQADEAVLSEVESAAKLYKATEDSIPDNFNGEVGSNHPLVGDDNYLEEAPVMQADINGGPNGTVTISNDTDAAPTTTTTGTGDDTTGE